MIRNLTLCVSLLAANYALAQASDPMASCPMHAQHMADGSAKHGKEVDQRHDTFGMPHEGSTHSFRLFADGGAIELRVNKADDEPAIAAIRTHLQHVSEQFRAADFSTPAFVHGSAPAGVAAMKQLRAEIDYEYQPLPAGGRIRIITKSAQALAAVHDFLRFQVTEHRTSDSGKVEADK